MVVAQEEAVASTRLLRWHTETPNVRVIENAGGLCHSPKVTAGQVEGAREGKALADNVQAVVPCDEAGWGCDERKSHRPTVAN